jgi:hypothetical protein
MISVPKDFQNNLFLDARFKRLVEFFNNLEESLRYPNCEGNADAKRILSSAQNQLIQQGFL